MDDNAIGVGFDTDGETIRLRLDLRSAKHLMETLAMELAAHARSHSVKSCGIPSAAVSTPEDGVKV